MTNQNLYVDINVLQTVPASNINRDDTGTPKTVIYGGVTRSRVSSQSWKRAVRQKFANEDKDGWIEGIRTTRVPELLAAELKTKNDNLSDEDAMKQALSVFSAVKIKVDKKTNRTKALLMVSKGQLKKLADYLQENEEIDSKEIKKMLRGDRSLDMALFGRMVADDPSLNVDAAAQVAHAISTHEIVPEFDYYTAVDDGKSSEESGSAMLGTIEYNSSTLYRYANVNVNELVHSLGNEEVALKGTALFIKDFIMSMPTGKQNTFANKTVPQYVMVTIRKDTPVNLVSAFEKPVKSRDGYVQPSIKRLEGEYQETEKFVEAPLATYILTNKSSEIDEQTADLNDLVKKVSSAIEAGISDESSNN